MPATEIAREHLGRPLPNAVLLGGFAALTGVVSLESVADRDRAPLRGPDRRAERRRGHRPRTSTVRARMEAPTRCLSRRRARGRWPRRWRGAGREVICAYPISPQTHIVEHLSDLVRDRRARPVRVRERGVRVRGDVGGDRRLGHRRARLHGDREPGPPLHGRGALQRVRARAADRDDGRQPGDRRADQHLERPLRLDVPARLGLDPALRRVEPGGARPPHPGLQARRGAVAAGDGVHGRVHPHPRLRGGRRARAGRRSTPSCRRTSRARSSTRPSR